MCGIAGARISEADLANIDMAEVVRALALGIEHRGKDASGILTVSPTGRVKVRKDALPMSSFLADHEGIGSGAKLVLIHARFSTQGSEKFNPNNHPVEHGDYIGIHNGVIQNDFELFSKNKNWKRTAEVDTEAIFAAIHHLGIQKGLEAVEGSMATAFIHVNQPLTLWMARGDYSPLCIIQSENGSVFFASTPEAVIEGARAAGLAATEDHVTEAGEGTIASADEDGVLICPKAFEPNPGWSRWAAYANVKTTTIPRGTKQEPTTSSYDYLDIEDEFGWEPVAEQDDVYITTSRGDRIYGRVIDVTDGQAWIEWDPRALPVGHLNVLSSRAGSPKSNVLQLGSGKES